MFFILSIELHCLLLWHEKNHWRNVANWLEAPEYSWTAGFTLAPVSAQAPWIEHQHWFPPGARWPGSQARWRQILVPHRQRWHYLPLPWPSRRNPCGAWVNFHQRVRTMTTILSILTRIFLLIPNSLEPKLPRSSSIDCTNFFKTPWFVCLFVEIYWHRSLRYVTNILFGIYLTMKYSVSSILFPGLKCFFSALRLIEV